MSELVVRTGSPRLTAIVCQGVDPDSGERCGKTYVSPSQWGTILDQARAAGWRIGRLADGTPDAMCPSCGKPDPATVALTRELGRSVRP